MAQDSLLKLESRGRTRGAQVEVRCATGSSRRGRQLEDQKCCGGACDGDECQGKAKDRGYWCCPASMQCMEESKTNSDCFQEGAYEVAGQALDYSLREMNIGKDLMGAFTFYQVPLFYPLSSRTIRLSPSCLDPAYSSFNSSHQPHDGKWRCTEHL